MLDERGAQVTRLWLNIPLLPQYIRVWRSPDRRVSSIQLGWLAPRRVPPVRSIVVFDGVVLVVLAIGMSHHATTGNWMSRIPELLVTVLGLCAENRRWWLSRHRR